MNQENSAIMSEGTGQKIIKLLIKSYFFREMDINSGGFLLLQYCVVFTLHLEDVKHSQTVRLLLQWIMDL